MAIHVSIEGYDSLEQIGVGGMAAVYKARKVSIDKTVAIKVLFPYLASDESFIDRFQREAKAAARIQHENIVNVIDFGESEGSYFIVMEYYDGNTVEHLIKERSSLPMDIAVQILLEVSFGLEAAHAQDIVHRDIKPGNLIFTRQGGIKVADFGLAKRSDSMTMITQHGKVIGTPAYMSPEQAAGGNVGTASDIFSLGVVAYEMLCQCKPFEGNSYSEVLERIQTYDPPAIVNLNPLIQPDIEGVISRMLEKDESRRYDNMGDVITDLEKAMEKLHIPRDRRRLKRYIEDPDAYDAAFREKIITRCLSQGAFYMQKGQTHLDDAMLEFKRILHLDPTNERARKNLDKVLARRGKGGDRTVTLTAVDPVSAVSETGGEEKREEKKKQATPRPTRRPATGRSRGARRVGVVAIVAGVLAIAGYVGAKRGVIPGFGVLPGGNEAPALSAPEALSVSAGEELSFSLQAVDADGDEVTLSAVSLPGGASLDEQGKFTWTPGYDQEGSHRVTFRAEDGISSTRATTTIVVQAPNVTIDFDPVQPVRVDAGKNMTRKLRAASSSGEPVTFSLEDGPGDMKIAGDELRWKVPGDASGTFSATVIASDGRESESRVVTVHVEPKAKPQNVARKGTVQWTLPEAANIYVDGSLRKRNTKSINVDLDSGRHTLRAELPSGITGWSEVVDVHGGGKTQLRAPELEYGSLSVYFLGSVGEFQVNGKLFDHQPPFSAVPIPVGEHVVSCRMHGEDDHREFTIRVEKGKETIIEYELGNEPVISFEG